METKASFWQKIGLQDWFLTNEKGRPSKKELAGQKLTPDEIYRFIIEKFRESIKQLSFGNRVVFYHEYMVAFNQDDYQEFVAGRQGILAIIVTECVNEFYKILKQHRDEGKKVVPSGSKWVFRLVSHPDYAPGDKGLIGKLLPESTAKDDNLRVTFIPRQTGIARQFDINQEILQNFIYYSDSYYELPFQMEQDENTVYKPEQKLARLTAVIPEKQFVGRNVEYLMKDQDIYISGKDETRSGSEIFKIPSDWVNTPHLHIRYNKAVDKFYLASFGEKTLLNEQDVVRSDVNSPQWVELPVNSRILLNGIIGINLFKV